MAKQYKVIAGPSREELFDALRLRHEGRQVSFTVSILGFNSSVVVSTKMFPVLVNSIGVEDGSGENWRLKLFDLNRHLESEFIEAFFNTVHRKGWARPIS